MTTIKDAPIVEQLMGTEKIPVSNGSGKPAAVTVNQILGKSGIKIIESEEELENLMRLSVEQNKNLVLKLVKGHELKLDPDVDY